MFNRNYASCSKINLQEALEQQLVNDDTDCSGRFYTVLMMYPTFIISFSSTSCTCFNYFKSNQYV